MSNHILRPLKYLFFFIFIISLFPSCVSVKAYQKMYLNDEEMQLTPAQVEAPENHSQAYREGASGADKGGKSGGGCGCN
jgi:hypothetical protein